MIGSVVNKYPCICLWLHCYQNSFLCLRKCIQCSTSTDCFTFVPCRGTHPSHIDHDRRDTPLNVMEGLDAGEVEIVFLQPIWGSCCSSSPFFEWQMKLTWIECLSSRAVHPVILFYLLWKRGIDEKVVVISVTTTATKSNTAVQ